MFPCGLSNIIYGMSEPLRPVAPPLPPTPPPAPASGTRAKEEKIVVIPDSYYGVAVQMQPPFFTDDEVPAAPPLPPTPPPAPVVAAPVPAPVPVEHGSRLAIAGLVLLVILLAGGGWVYWNREALFAPSTAPVVVVQTPAPNPPVDLIATSTAPGTVRLEWQDRSESEDGYRVERQTALDSAFVPLQTLPANSRTFLDQSAPPDTSVSYRVVAFNRTAEAPALAPIAVRVQALPPVAPAQPTLPPDGLDLDSDGLTDVEERVYSSNGQLPDSDGDGYLDGNEVFNLYSPTQAAPASLLGTSLLGVVSSTVGWETHIPRAWQVEVATSSAVTVRIPTGELIVVRVENNAERLDLRSWLVAKRGWRSDQIYELLSNKYKVPFFLGADRLTGYIAWEDKVVIVSYQLGTQSFVNYRTTFGLIMNSFRLNGSPNVPDLSSPSMIPSVFQPQPLMVTTTSATSTTVAPPVVTSSVVAPTPTPTAVSTSTRP